MSHFNEPAEHLATVNGKAVAALLGAAADITLVLDKQGVIRDLSVSSEELIAKNADQWLGSQWVDTVAQDSQAKVRELLCDETSSQKQINQRTDQGENVLILYNIVHIDDKDFLVAVGRDLSSLTRMQQRLVNVQQSMERDYSRLRQYETRYRLLFQTAGDAILIIDAETFRVVEANPVACQLLGNTERKIVGSLLLRWFEPQARQLFEDALASVRLSGHSVTVTLDLEESHSSLLVNLALFKTSLQTQVLVRLEKKSLETDPAAQSEYAARVMALVEHAPDALVISDMNGQILTANTEFLDLSQLTDVSLAAGRELSGWLGQGGIDFQIIMSSVREHGSIRLYSTQMRGQYGSVCDVEVSATVIAEQDMQCVAFSIRNTSRRLSVEEDSSALAPKSIDQLTQLVGRVPLKDLVRESTELIEQLCIQSALRLTNNNRASAAEMLGLSRQSLYVKLRRYSLDDENTPAA